MLHRPSADCLNPLRENHQLAGDISQSSDPLPGLTKHFSQFYKGLKCPRGDMMADECSYTDRLHA